MSSSGQPPSGHSPYDPYGGAAHPPGPHSSGVFPQVGHYPQGAPTGLGAPHGAPPQWAGHGTAHTHRRGGGAALTAVVAGLIGLGLGVGGAWLLIGGDGPGDTAASDPEQIAGQAATDPATPDPASAGSPTLTGAQADAAHACLIAREQPSDLDLMALGGLDEDPTHYRLSAIHELALAASIADPLYEDLAEHAGQVRTGMITFAADAFDSGLEDLRIECDALGL